VPHSEQTAITWRKSTASGHNGNCVEIAAVGDSILIRNSRNPLGSFLSFTRQEWRSFLKAVNNGDFILGPVQK
jgi:hypothetical protein